MHSHQPARGSPRRVAIVRALRGLGDMLCLVPALRAIRASLPRATVHLVGLAEARWLPERYPKYLDGIVEFPGYPGIPEVEYDPSRLVSFVSQVQGSYDLAIQMHGSGTSSNAFTALLGARQTAGYCLPALWCPEGGHFTPYPGHTHEIRLWLGLAGQLGFSSAGEELEFPVTADDREALKEAWPDADASPYVCIHPGANEEIRRWEPEKFAAVADELASRGHRIVLTGAASDRALCSRVAATMKSRPVDLSGRTGLGALAALLEGASLLVCNDTGVSHLAAALKTRSVVLFLASQPERWAPLDRRRHRPVGTPLPERRNACVHTDEVRGHRCLRDACSSLRVDPSQEWAPPSASEVIDEARSLLSRR